MTNVSLQDKLRRMETEMAEMKAQMRAFMDASLAAERKSEGGCAALDRPTPGKFGEPLNYYKETVQSETGELSVVLPEGLWSAALIGPLTTDNTIMAVVLHFHSNTGACPRLVL